MIKREFLKTAVTVPLLALFGSKPEALEVTAIVQGKPLSDILKGWVNAYEDRLGVDCEMNVWLDEKKLEPYHIEYIYSRPRPSNPFKLKYPSVWTHVVKRYDEFELEYWQLDEGFIVDVTLKKKNV